MRRCGDLMAAPGALQDVLDTVLERLEQQQREIDVLKDIVTAQAKQRIQNDVTSRKAGFELFTIFEQLHATTQCKSTFYAAQPV